jgi:hypothetical protein
MGELSTRLVFGFVVNCLVPKFRGANVDVRLRAVL